MSFLDLLRQAARMTLRDWRAGELRLLAAALAIAVAAVTSVGFFVDRLRLGLERDAAQLLGADLVINSDSPIGAPPRERAAAAGLLVSDTVTFPSMAANPALADAFALAAVKAVGTGYPLRGALRVRMALGEPDQITREIPAPGTVWIDPQAAQALQVQVGGSVRLGERVLRVERLIAVEPDRGGQFINFAPRVMLNLADLPGTRLLQAGSRVTWRLLVAGEPAPLRDYQRWLEPQLERGQRLESLGGGRPEMQRTLERADRFLALVALLAAMVAAVAVAAAARRFSLRHLDSCALMRCLGLAQRQLFGLFAGEFLIVGLLACAAGAMLGFTLHFVLIEFLRSFIATALPWPSALPAVQGLACGMVLLAGFALPPLAQLRQVPPLRVLRKDLGPPAGRAVLGYGLGFAGFFALLLWAANDLRVGALTAAGFAVAVLVFATVAWLGLRLLRPLRGLTGRLSVAWRFALAAIERRPAAAVVQLVALGVGLMALLLLTVTRTDLISAWRTAAPPDAPNRFVINIQPDQAAAVAARLQAAGLGAAELSPMVRGRLVGRNGAAVGPEMFANERAQRLVDREFNLSYALKAPTHNPIVAGRWFADGSRELSMEEGIARTLGIALGDRLSFEIAGNRIEATVTSLRKVDWDSMRPNFFVLMPPSLLADQPRSLITAFHLPETRAAFTGELLREFPNLTVVDTSAIFRQVQMVLDQVVAAVEFLFVFTLAAGVLVLYAALASTRDERVREAALLRALGASRQQLSRAQAVELVCLGGLAGLLAAAGAAAVGWVLGRYVFELDYAVTPWVFVAGTVGGAACAVAGGWLGLRQVLETPPLASLREA